MDTTLPKLSASSFARHFSTIVDPRKPGMCDHLLLDILFIAVLAVICGADGWDEIHDWGVSRKATLQQVLALPNGIPSADTFRRVFARIRPQAFEASFRGWIAERVMALRERAIGAIAIDGKTLRGAAKQAGSGAGLHLVHAWAVEERLLLGQVATAEKSNEITAIPDLLDLLDLEGAVVTIDAMGCQRAIAAKIKEGGGDYLLAVKDNQPSLLPAVQEVIEREAPLAPGATCSWTIDFKEPDSRQEVRRLMATSASALPMAERWEGVMSCGVVESDRTVKGVRTTERRYFITSLPHDDADRLLRLARGHWGVENNLHWVLDVAFREDASAVHEGHAPENLSLLRKIALTALKSEITFKAGIARKRKRAGWDDRYLFEVLTAGFK
jgi:predicted transposase YbfD/YdcC